MGKGEIPNTPEHQIETSGAPHGQEITLGQFFLWLPGRTQRAVDEHLRSRHRGETRRPDKIANFKKNLRETTITVYPQVPYCSVCDVCSVCLIFVYVPM